MPPLASAEKRAEPPRQLQGDEENVRKSRSEYKPEAFRMTETDGVSINRYEPNACRLARKLNVNTDLKQILLKALVQTKKAL